ncbi:MAG: hypothetical protein NTV70_12820 [Acidobacteria bacterium]|nr:hypothetical protein [Acidobacteriota bacterium]
MRTTIELPDALFRELKAQTGREGISLKEFVTEAVREKLADGPSRRPTVPPLALPLIPKGRFPGLQSVTNEEVERLLWDEKLPR